MHNIILLLPLFASSAFAAVFVDGPCPIVRPVENFNMSAFHRDRWYEIARYSNDFEKKADCVHVDHYIENGRNMIKFNELIDNNYFDFYYSYIVLNPKAGTTGILDYSSRNMTEPEGDTGEIFTFTVLDTDYDNYIILYRCKYNEEKKNHHDYAWIASRKRKLEGDVKAKVENFIKSSGFLDINKFMFDHYELDICKV